MVHKSQVYGYWAKTVHCMYKTEIPNLNIRHFFFNKQGYDEIINIQDAVLPRSNRFRLWTDHNTSTKRLAISYSNLSRISRVVIGVKRYDMKIRTKIYFILSPPCAREYTPAPLPTANSLKTRQNENFGNRGTLWIGGKQMWLIFKRLLVWREFETCHDHMLFAWANHFYPPC